MSPLSVPSRTVRTATALLAGVGLAAGMASAPAQASTRTPAKATHVRLVAATGSSLTVGSSKAARATKYRVYVSTVKSDLHYANLIHGTHTSARHSATGTSPRVTVRGLRYTTAPFWYRVQTINGNKSAYSADILSGGLMPSVPTSLTVTDVGGLSLTWRSGAVTGYEIAQSTTPSMAGARRSYTISGNTHQFTPYGLRAGQAYYFRIRAVNNGTRSAYSNEAANRTSAHEMSLRVSTYNLLLTQSDGSKEAGGTVQPWSTRGPAAAALIKRINPDVLAVQEAGGWVNKTNPGPGNPGVRQVDSLMTYLGSGYGLAHTENTWSQMAAAHSYVRHYSYIIYKKSSVAPVGTGGYWALDSSKVADPHWGVYQELRSVRTGATFLFTSSHLVVGYSSALDARRRSEATILVSNTRSLAASLGVKAIYAGDFNSNINTKYHPLDGPGSVMRSAGIVDSRLVAQSHTNSFNSMNFLQRTPMPYPFDVIDYVFASPGVSVTAWSMGLNLSKGRLVGVIPSDHNPVSADVVVRY